MPGPSLSEDNSERELRNQLSGMVFISYLSLNPISCYEGMSTREWLCLAWMSRKVWFTRYSRPRCLVSRKSHRIRREYQSKVQRRRQRSWMRFRAERRRISWGGKPVIVYGYHSRVC
ncbi:hypothetical protein K435DRAFT_127437 [Dendrothele bispora CBS 962.96]|uniref:Uncharacterized protein n=1 Tax=Dendrothele bispora (strain CBS 962.96) TaxID=1314807 RepID=A0A4S8KMP3_DENBC|nr:hypothetical protein K435DRAFT_127437 [Dendrothele bispora CBS 962.96]